jgi:hypothetical protein
MGFNSYDAFILGAILTTGSPIFFGKAYLFPSFPDEAAQMVLDGNPFHVRNAIIQRYEAIAGTIWLAGGLVNIILGTLWTAQGWQTSYFIGPYLDILVLLVAGVVAGAVTIIITTTLSQRVYRPRMIEMQRELFAGHAFILSHEGRDREQVDRGENVPAESRQRRLAEVAPNLDQIGKLLDVPRGERETDDQFVERLKPHFSSRPVDRRWTRWTRAIRWLTRRGL